MPFSSIQIATATPSPTMQDRRGRRLSSEEADRIIRIARRKSSDGCASSNKDRNLRVLLGHAHIAETLKHEFLDYFHNHSSSKAEAPCYRPQPIKPWTDSFAKQRVTTEDEAVAFEDDGEEDFESLSLVRTPSRSAQPPRSPVHSTNPPWTPKHTTANQPLPEHDEDYTGQAKLLRVIGGGVAIGTN